MDASACQTPPDQVAVIQTVRENLGFAELTDYAWVRFAGPDAAQFLQNRLSNDVLALKTGQGQMNTALDRQGKIQGVFDLYRADDAFSMLIDRAQKDHALSQIEKFHILENFKTEDRSTSVVIFAVQGPNSPQVLAHWLNSADLLPELEMNWRTVTVGGCTFQLIRRTITGETGFLLVLPANDAQPVLDSLKTTVLDAGGVEIQPEALETLRIESGQLRYGTDYDFETLLPETGLERVAVSYSKGCYLGQETIARVKTYGMVQKALAGLLFEPDASVPPQNATLLLDGKSIGQLTSATFSATLKRPVALAYLGKAERVPGRRLTLEIAGIQYSAEVALLPFYQSGGASESGQVLLQQGLGLFSDGYDEEAIRILQAAIEAQPDLLEAYEALGVILSRHERYMEAIALMEKVLTLDPDHVLAHTNLSVFYMKLGDKEKAEEEKAKATIAAFSQKAKAAGLTFDLEAERRKKEQAALDKIAMFEEALKFNPADPLGNFGLGSCYLELKRYAEAIEPFRKMLKAQPRHSVAYLSLGKAQEGAGEKQAALDTYRKGIEVAAAKGDLMPLKEMQVRLEALQGAL